jgi:hypothetical protein
VVVVLLVVCACLAVWYGPSVVDPRRRSAEGLNRWLRKRTLIRSTVDEVRAVIAAEGWQEDYQWRGEVEHPREDQFPYVRGHFIIGADLGDYQVLPWRVWTSA